MNDIETQTTVENRRFQRAETLIQRSRYIVAMILTVVALVFVIKSLLSGSAAEKEQAHRLLRTAVSIVEPNIALIQWRNETVQI